MNRAVARPGYRRPPGRGPPQPAPPAEPADSDAPRPDLRGTIFCLLGLAATAFCLRGSTPEDVARFGAVGVLVSLVGSICFDLRRGIHNVVLRTDLMALVSLYFLTLAEFLGKQQRYNSLAGMNSTRTAVLACIWAYAGIVAGRHLVPPKRKHPFQERLPAAGAQLRSCSRSSGPA